MPEPIENLLTLQRPTDPADELRRLLVAAEALAGHRLPPPGVAAWLSDRLVEHIATGRPLVNGNYRARYRRELRDHYLRQAGAELDGLPWPRAGQLAAEIRRFVSIVWPSWKALTAPPQRADRLRSALFHARRYGSLPEKRRRLHDILTANNGCSDCGD